MVKLFLVACMRVESLLLCCLRRGMKVPLEKVRGAVGHPEGLL